MRRIRLAASVMLLASCASSVEFQPAIFSSSNAPDSLRAQYPARIHHRITGDADYTLDIESVIDIYESHGPGVPVGVWILTASAGRFDIQLSDGSLLLWSADLRPGQYEGPGTYEIDGKDAPDLAESSSLRSAAYVQITRPAGGEESLTRYDVLVEPCTLTYAANAASGEVRCPALGLDRDPSRTIEWLWTWERLPLED
ncbi:MAG: hypothetical protein ACLGH3_04650 [Actinomycetota bacterium]